MMAKIKQLDPLDIHAVMEWIAQTSKLRVLVMLPGDRRKRAQGALWAYSVTRPDPELEHDVRARGGVVVGYYTRQAAPANVMADIASSMVEL